MSCGSIMVIFNVSNIITFLVRLPNLVSSLCHSLPWNHRQFLYVDSLQTGHTWGSLTNHPQAGSKKGMETTLTNVLASMLALDDMNN